MRPNQLGGWIAEGADEQVVIAQSLQNAGELDLLIQLNGQRVTRREVVLARHPEWAGKVVSDTFVNMLAEDDWEAARILSQPLLPITNEQTPVVEEALKTASGRWIGRKPGLEKHLRKTARAMVRTMTTANS